LLDGKITTRISVVFGTQCTAAAIAGVAKVRSATVVSKSLRIATPQPNHRVGAPAARRHDLKKFRAIFALPTTYRGQAFSS
jgi:hypothetical protein